MPILEISNLKKYYKKIKAVDDISFSVKKGGVFGLLGPNGAGKSTTISMISTLLKPTDGLIYYKGKNIIKEPLFIQKNLGVVPQEIALYPTLTGIENLKFWGHAYGLRGNELDTSINKIAEIIGLKDKLKMKIENYSGGMKRRMNIGAALLHEPELLIMDEPTVGIDPQSRKHILDTVLQLNQKGMTIIYTSHYMEEVEYLCSNISIMDKGKIIASGTKKELLNILEGDKKIYISFEKISKKLINEIKALTCINKVDVIDDELIVSTSNEKELFKSIMNIASNCNTNVVSIDIKKPNLEAVFLHLTGRALRD